MGYAQEAGMEPDVRRDHANRKSPNCAWNEAAAGAMHTWLGGMHDYFGKPVEKPIIGDNERPVQKEDIDKVNRLLYGASTLMMAPIMLAAIIG